MSITKQNLNLDSEKLAKIHNKLCDKMLELLDSELIEDPKILTAIIHFLNNNDINCSPLTGLPANEQTDALRQILSEMTTNLDADAA